MPLKSEAQRRKLAGLVKEGKLSKETFDKMSGESAASLPEHAKPKSKKISEKVRTIKQAKVIK